ncbi:sensor histidine kinase [Tautonia sociabilis]|uniref:histidine kinase n=1 Tax=Tautonia sociabilis TaxID=2080755 RepID=A0A432MEP3_9BACT|nr:heavy metal sensor histidine kinase [Tautonia sociabilis]RUL84013.1 HAMP domain-containing protein [Tautonia sociabilis]
MKGLSIRWKLTAWYGAVLAAVLAAFGAAVYLTMRHQLYGQVASGLLMEMGEVNDEVGRARDLASLRAGLNRRFTRHPSYDIQVTTPSGEVLLRSERIRPDGLPVPAPLPSPQEVNLQRLPHAEQADRYLATKVVASPVGPVVVQVATTLAHPEHELGELLAVLLVLGPLALSAAIGGGYLLARKALEPVERMTEATHAITASRLDRRIEVVNPDDELGRLARTLNTMIERLERSFDETRRFTADAAHELRTPLAVLRSEAEVALRQPRSPEEHRRVLENILEEVDRLTRLAEQLLFLCREDAGLVPVARGSVRIDELLSEVIEHMRPVAEENGVMLHVEPSASTEVSGDADQLRRLFFNLLDNAIKYTPRGGRIVGRVEPSGGGILAIVSDTGIGIPHEHLPRVFERFYRVDQARTQDTGGAGLGLSICRAIAEAHGGQLRIESELGRGTRVLLSLPAARPQGGRTDGHHRAESELLPR